MRRRTVEAGGRDLALRLAIGLGQGAALYALMRAEEAKAWPASEPLVFAPAVLVALFVPLIALAGRPALRPGTLLAWMAAATAVLTAVALHDVTWQGDAPAISDRAIALLFVAAAGLFIAQALITAGGLEERYVASYSACFDAAWKLAVQVVLTVAFTGTFWVILTIGASLFALIGLKGFGTVIGEAWFWVPATTLAVAGGLHLTDVQPAIVRGIRTLKLTLLSWLLPLLTGIVVVFLASLPFTGLAPLWETRMATPILLGVIAGLVLLVNAAYQDGGEGRARGLPRAAMAAAAASLLPLLAITAYGLGLRVLQHGWTASRVFAAAGVTLAGIYALGYAWALVRSRLAMRELETTNLAAAFAALALIVALFTPIADPARLAVASQVARLQSGAVAWAEFDLRHLRFDAGRYGLAALERLKAEARDPAVARDIETALAAKTRFDLAGAGPAKPKPPDAEAIRGNLTAHPPGRALPGDFPLTGWGREIDRLACLDTVPGACDVFLIDMDGDGREELILADRNSHGSVLFARSEERWIVAGYIDGLVSCGPAIAALREGNGRTAPMPWGTLTAGGQRFAVTLPSPAGPPVCY